MKFTLTGSLGNITKPLAIRLKEAGHQVTIISSNAGKVSAIEALGATAAIGSVTDAEFLSTAFKGADAIYTMIPPNFVVPDYIAYMAEVGRIFATAIKKSGVKRVVNLSSIGADLPSGTGPIAGLYQVEKSLNELEKVSVKHLRPAFFYTNFLHDIAMIKNNNIMGSNFEADADLKMTHPKDIAEAAANALLGDFEGKSYEYVVSDETTVNEIPKKLGVAIGKADLPWVEFTDEQYLGGLTGAGFPASIANLYVEMGRAVNQGILWTDFKKQKSYQSGRTKLADFAVEFATAYQN